MADLSGTGRVSDDLYLLAHNDVTGKPCIHSRALGLGLAGGLLAELMLAGSISLGPAGISVAGGRPPQDGLAQQVLGLLAGEHQRHSAREWLLFMARTAARDVAIRLARSGYLASASKWGPRRARWVPVDADIAFAPLLRVRAALDPSRPVSACHIVLAGLADGCGLGFRLAEYTPSGAGRSIDEAVRLIDPGLRELIRQTHAAVDSAVLAHRM